MSITDDYAAAVGHLRAWGFQVVEWDGCYGRSNGGSWSGGRPAGHGNHHYVCSLNPDQGYINGLVGNLAAGDVVNWFADVNGVAYLVGTGPMNHFGTGNQSVLDATRNDQPPPGAATSQGSISGNAHYSGTECQHPGDSTPWPGPMLDVMVAINAAEFLVWGYTSARAINHYEWTNRKIDMSAGGGPDSGGWAGDELRRRVAARMAGTAPGPGPGPGGPNPPAVPTLTEVDMYIVHGPNGAKLCGPGYEKNLDGEEYEALTKVPGMQVVSVDGRGFDVHGAAMTNGHSANDIARQ